MTAQQKYFLICMALILTVVSIACIILKIARVAELPKGVIESDCLGVTSRGFGKMQVLPDSSYISLSENGKLCIVKGEKRKEVASDILRFAIVDKSVAYMDSYGTISIFSGEKSMTIATNVSQICSDKKELFFYSEQDCGVYSIKDGLRSLRFTLPEKVECSELIATKLWIVVCSSTEDVYCFNRTSKKITCISAATDIFNREPFVYKDYLIDVGYYYSGGMVYSLNTGERKPIDFGWNGMEHTTTISVTADDTNVFVSLESQIWPQFGQETYTGTFLLNLEEMETILVNSNYYENLLLTSTDLYGGSLSEIQFITNKKRVGAQTY